MSRYRRGTRLVAEPKALAISVEDAIREYLESQRRRACSTSYLDELRSYLIGQGQRTRWLPFLPWTKALDLRALDAVSKRSFEDSLSSVERNSSRSNYCKVCAVLHRFLQFSKSAGFITELPLQVPRPKRPRSHVQVFTQDEIARLRDVVIGENPRDWAIFVLLCDTGIRARELCSLRLTDVHLDREELTT